MSLQATCRSPLPTSPRKRGKARLRDALLRIAEAQASSSLLRSEGEAWGGGNGNAAGRPRQEAH